MRHTVVVASSCAPSCSRLAFRRAQPPARAAQLPPRAAPSSDFVVLRARTRGTPTRLLFPGDDDARRRPPPRPARNDETAPRRARPPSAGAVARGRRLFVRGRGVRASSSATEGRGGRAMPLVPLGTVPPSVVSRDVPDRGRRRLSGAPRNSDAAGEASTTRRQGPSTGGRPRSPASRRPAGSAGFLGLHGAVRGGQGRARTMDDGRWTNENPRK